MGWSTRPHQHTLLCIKLLAINVQLNLTLSFFLPLSLEHTHTHTRACNSLSARSWSDNRCDQIKICLDFVFYPWAALKSKCWAFKHEMVIGTSKSRKKVSLDWSKENTKHVWFRRWRNGFCQEYKVIICISQQKNFRLLCQCIFLTVLKGFKQKWNNKKGHITVMCVSTTSDDNDFI